MTNFGRRAGAGWEWIKDRLWPYAPEASEDSDKSNLFYEYQLKKFRNAAKSIETIEGFTQIKGLLEKWLDAERLRRAALESRLNALAGLAGGSAALLGALLGNA